MKRKRLLSKFCFTFLIFLLSFLFIILFPKNAEANCTGGNISYVGNDVVHRFTGSGTLSCPFGASFQYLIIGGGGGGGARNGGGGGAGGILEGTTTQSAGSHSVVVGGGGRGGTRNPYASWTSPEHCATTVGWQGGNSSVFGLIAIGGGGGGGGGGGPHACHTPSSGGSGGGGGRPHTNGGTRAGGSGTSGQGSNGGTGTTFWTGSHHATSAGGGGSRDPGGSRIHGDYGGILAGGCGGYGRFVGLTGSNVCYGGGGGGCPGHHSGGYGRGGGWPPGRPCGSGNPGGGGDCGASQHGGANTGGGGGGGSGNNNAGWGGSGVVVVRYLRRWEITHVANGGSCNSNQWISHGSGGSSPSCTRTDYNLTHYAITSGSCSGTFNASTGTCSNVQSNIQVTAYWELANQAPTIPIDVKLDGEHSPAVTGTVTPTFSAVFVDPDPGDYASQYQIQVSTQPTLLENGSFPSENIVWDTGLQNITANNPTSGVRFEVEYTGPPLSLDGTTYYWHMRFADSHGLLSPWCRCSVCEFTMNEAPTEPTDLLAEGETNPEPVNTLTPVFSAIFNDPDEEDEATEYHIQVNTQANFEGTMMWDSGLEEMDPTPVGDRSPDIEYDGTTLSFNGSKYYWRIRFADEHGTVGPWSDEEAHFTMNTPPTAPSDLLTENLTNPTEVSTPNPKFSAIFNDPDIVDTSSYYRIQVNTNSSFTGSTMWDSTKSSMETTDKGQRSPEIPYNGTTLTPNGVTYYWRIRFWDSADVESPWSSTASFKMEENQAPSEPTGLLVDGHTNHQRVNNLNPVFSAIFEDPNTFDFSNHYQLQVNTEEDFNGTTIWDSGKQSMNTTQKGERPDNITYDGSELSLDGTTYYWRIRFWDANDAVGEWGTGYFITSGAYTTFEGIRFDGIRLD